MSVILDGTSDYYSGTSVSVPSSKTGTLSAWFKPDNVTDTQAVLVARNSGTGVTSLYLTFAISGAFDRISINGRNAAGTAILGLVTNSVGLAVDTWYHVMACWDTENSLGLVYLDGTALAPTQTFVDEAIPFVDATAWQVGTLTDDTGVPGNLFDGTLDDIYFTTTYIDLSTAANRRLFYGREGTKVGLGYNGWRPTGSQPEILLTHGPNNYGQNAGTSGDLSTVGAPTFYRGRPAAHETLSRGFYGERWRESERSGIPFRESQLLIEPASSIEVARREYSTDRDEINRRKRFGHTIFEH